MSDHSLAEVLHRAADVVGDYLASLPDRPVWEPLPQALRERFEAMPLPIAGRPLEEIMTTVASSVLPWPMGNNHPRFFGWVNSPATPASVVAALLAAAMNPSVAGGNQAAVLLEETVLRWVRELLRLDPAGDAILVGGGSAANIVGLAAARQALLERRGWDVRRDGLAGAPRIRLLCTAEAHSSITRAAELLGIGSGAIEIIPHDADFRMEVAPLAQRLAADSLPTIVVASAGTVNCGAVDPLDAIADLCRDHGAWLHVDGAYGAPAVVSPATRELVAPIARADSLSVDPHKWLYVAIDCGCAIVRHPGLLRDTFSLVPPYLRDPEGRSWLSEQTFEQTRPFRALRLFAALLERGAEGYMEAITRDIGHARRLADDLASCDDFDLLARPMLSIVPFRYMPRELRGDARAIDDLNRALPAAVQRRGEIFLTGTELDGRPALRACFVNWRTTAEDVAVIPDAVRRAAHDLC